MTIDAASPPENVPPALPPAFPVLAHRRDGLPGASTVLLLNGGFMTAGSWKPIAEPLAASHGVVRCDFRGQLLTPGPAHRDLADNVADVVRLLDHLGLARVHVLGTSFGGLVGVLLAARHPQRVTSLVTAAVADHSDAAMTAATRELRRDVASILAAEGPAGDRGRFYDLLVPEIFSPAYVAASREALAARRAQVAALPDAWFGELDALLEAVEGFDLRPELAAVRCPTLVVVAGGDAVMPPASGDDLAAAIPGARVARHAASGHTLVVEDPEWLVARALELFAEVDRAG